MDLSGFFLWHCAFEFYFFPFFLFFFCLYFCNNVFWSNAEHSPHGSIYLSKSFKVWKFLSQSFPLRKFSFCEFVAWLVLCSLFHFASLSFMLSTFYHYSKCTSINGKYVNQIGLFSSVIEYQGDFVKYIGHK